MAAKGQLDAEYIRVDSEFSAASVLFPVHLPRVRAYTAPRRKGLALMTEVIFSLAGSRLPRCSDRLQPSTFVAHSAWQPDHQDTMLLRDSGIIECTWKAPRKAYDSHLQAFKIAEHPDIHVTES